MPPPASKRCSVGNRMVEWCTLHRSLRNATPPATALRARRQVAFHEVGRAAGGAGGGDNS